MKSLGLSFRCRSIVSLWSFCFAALGCGSKPVPLSEPGTAEKVPPKTRPPTPKSVTRSNPGGDAPDPHEAALRRLLEAPWGARNDKDDQVHAPTPDWENWKRVRYYSVEH